MKQKERKRDLTGATPLSPHLFFLDGAFPLVVVDMERTFPSSSEDLCFMEPFFFISLGFCT